MHLIIDTWESLFKFEIFSYRLYMSAAPHHHLTPAALEMIGVEEPRHENSVQERTVQCLENSVPPNMRTVVVDDVHIISVKCLIVTPVSCNIRSNIHHSVNIFCIIEQWRWKIIIVNQYLHSADRETLPRNVWWWSILLLVEATSSTENIGSFLSISQFIH